MSEQTSLFSCRSCAVELTRENTGGYRAGHPDVCKACEASAYNRAYAASLVPLTWAFPYPISGAEWE